MKKTRTDLSLIKLILPYAARERSLYILALVLLPFSVAIPLFPPRLVKQIVDQLFSQGLSNGLYAAVGLLLAVVLCNFMVTTAFQNILRKIGLRIMRNIRIDLFRRMQSFPLEYFRTEPKGRIVARLTTDLEQIDAAFASGGLMLVADIFSVVAITVAMLSLSARLGMWGLVVIPVMLVVITWISRIMRRIVREVRRLTSKMNAFAQEALSAHDVIAVLGAQKNFCGKFDDISMEFETTTLEANRYEAAFFAGIDFFGSIAVAMVIFGAIVWTGQARAVTTVTALGSSGSTAITAGLLIAMTQYVQQFFVPLRGLATRFSTFQQAMVALERVDNFLGLPVEPVEGSGLATRATRRLNVENLEFHYRSDKPVLVGVNLDITPGTHVALLGETGCGKSTLARILMGFYRQERGRISWGISEGVLPDANLDRISLHDRRKIITLVPQEVFLFDATVMENITLGKAISDDEYNKIVSSVGLDKLVSREAAASGGLGEWGRRLSEGEKQLIAAARVIVYDPALVILDEATSSLDPLLDSLVRAAIKKALEGRSALIIAHRLSTLQSADRIAVMHKGAIVEQGTHGELYASGGIYAKLHRLIELHEAERKVVAA